MYDASGALIAEYSGEVAQEPRVSYLTTDHLGSPRVVTDERGSVASRRDFTAFGEESFTVQRTQGLGYQPTEIRQNYTGYEKDEESGLEFAQARYYNPTHGRFTSVDPLVASATIRNPQTFNRYSYGLNSPYKFTDPLGLLSQYTTGACGGSCSNSESRWTQSSGGPMTSGGVDSSFDFLLASVGPRSPQSAPPSADPVLAAAAAAGLLCDPNFDYDAFAATMAPSVQSSQPETEVSESAEARALYNCMAWALGFTDRWIDPIYYRNGGRGGGYREVHDRHYDSSGTELGDTVYFPGGEEFKQNGSPYSMVQVAEAYGAKQSVKVDGVKVTAGEGVATPAGYYKLGVFEGKNYLNTHVMKQESDGTWSSKNGDGSRFSGIKDANAFYQSAYGPASVKPTYFFRKISRLGRQ